MADLFFSVFDHNMQGFNGADDPDNREDLWRSGFATNGDLFKTVSTLVQWRKTLPASFFNAKILERYVDDSIYVCSCWGCCSDVFHVC